MCRASAEHYREYVIKRKAELVAEERHKEAERQRLERERLRRLEEARIARLLAQARALQQAQEIRAYVAAVQTRSSTDTAMTALELQQWVDWSLQQADRLDPVINGGFRHVQHDE